MGFEELYDGDEHWLEPGTWPGWTRPHVRVLEVVEVHGWNGDRLESPDVALVVAPLPEAEVSVWYGEDGWSALAVMTRDMMLLLGASDGVGGLEIEQHVVRHPDWKVKSKHQKIRVPWSAVEDGDLVEIEMPEGL